MSPFERINTHRSSGRPPFSRPALTRSPWSRRFSKALPWVFVLGIAAGNMLPVRHWVHWPPHSADSEAARQSEAIWRQAGSPEVRHPVDVVRTIDGDTFEARVHLPTGPDLTTRVRLRGIDAPELKASCPRELQLAEAATVALRDLLGQGD